MMYKQRGASYLGIFAAIVLAAFAAKLAIAIWPAYWDDRLIDKTITSLLESSGKNTTPTVFKQKLAQQLDMNNIRDVKVDDIVQVTNVSGISVKKEYEVRKPFMMNIDLVMTFKKDF